MTDPATQKQIEFIIDLGGKVSIGLTKNDASILIRQLLEDKDLKKKQELLNRSRNAKTTRIRDLDTTGINYNRKPYTPVEVPSKDDKIGGYLALVIIIGLIIGGLILYNSDTDSSSKGSNPTVVSDQEYIAEELVFISRYGDCYHYYSNCISLDNINADVQVYARPLSSVTNSHRLCDICRRNAGF